MIFKILEAISLRSLWIVFSFFCFVRWQENCQPCLQMDPRFVSHAVKELCFGRPLRQRPELSGKGIKD